MEPKLIELHFSQLQAEWAVSKYNTYSDTRKQAYHENLKIIIAALEKENFEKLDDNEIEQRFLIIFFVFKSLEFLNHSTTSTIPFELVYVLELALKEWFPGEDEYLIVTSLINGINEFSFDNSLTFADFVYENIKHYCDVSFDKKLVQINLPESTSRDYLANVVLYHELGHFIEKKYLIAGVIYGEILASLKGRRISKEDRQDIYRYFPYLNKLDLQQWLANNNDGNNMFSLHISEYFCDLFAAQYVKDSSTIYLEYITIPQSKMSSTHPSTFNRSILVQEYLSNKGGFVLKLYKDIVRKITNKELTYRAKDIKSTDFENLVPVTVKEPEELHSLFVYGWNVWRRDWKRIEITAKTQFNLSSAHVYQIINNLIEKSIGNYIIADEWEKGKKVKKELVE